MLVQKISIPQNSLINTIQIAPDYSDCFAINLNQSGRITPESFGQSFFSDFPRWVHFLMHLRNILVKPFKIPSDGSFDDIPFGPIQKGSRFSFLTVQDFNSNELLLFAPDYHLDTWISIFVNQENDQTKLVATTVVKFNNRTGRIYFSIIKPFHRLIVRAQLKRIYHKYLSNNF